MNEITNEIIEFQELLTPLYKHISTVLNSKLTGNITLSQLSVLKKIYAGITIASEISNSLQITPAATSKFVDQLVNLKYLERIQSETDRRFCNLQLTEEGIKILNENMYIRQQIFEKFLNALSEEEKSNLRSIISKINHMLKEC